MKSVKDTVEFILGYFKPLPPIVIDSQSARGFILREDVRALRDHPAFPTATMDGFAVKSVDFAGKDTQRDVKLSVVGMISAGIYPKKKLANGQAFQIMTGAIVPESSDAVVPVENTNWFDKTDIDHNFVSISGGSNSGDNIRPAGRDYQQGEVILPKGKLLRPREIAMIAMLGIPKVVVGQKPRIGILASGDELLRVGEDWEAGKIYNSNSSLLVQSVIESHADPVDLGIAEDSRQSVLEKFRKAETQEVDLIVASAGVSVSDRDFVRIVLEENGKINQWKVNLRPGKPLLFAEFGNQYILGLPGNPVSTYIGFKKFVLPVIQRLLGQEFIDQRIFYAQLGEEITSDGRETYIRGRLSSRDGCMIAYPVEHQDSGNLKGLVNSDVLIKIPAGSLALEAGSEVEIELI